jgi:hypothetical protein
MQGLDAGTLEEGNRGFLLQHEMLFQLEDEGVRWKDRMGSRVRGVREEEVPRRRRDLAQGRRPILFLSAAHRHREQGNCSHHTENADGETDEDRLHIPPFFSGPYLLGARGMPVSERVKYLVRNLFFPRFFLEMTACHVMTDEMSYVSGRRTASAVPSPWGGPQGGPDRSDS